MILQSIVTLTQSPLGDAILVSDAYKYLFYAQEKRRKDEIMNYLTNPRKSALVNRGERSLKATWI